MKLGVIGLLLFAVLGFASCGGGGGGSLQATVNAEVTRANAEASAINACTARWDALVAQWDGLSDAGKNGQTFASWLKAGGHPESYNAMCASPTP